MKSEDAEHLLGGYAAGILTAGEKAALFAAALEHQALFDALMDEEALRELLADPRARAALLAALAEPAAAPAEAPAAPRRPWRPPVWLGLAASLLLVATTTILLVRRGAPALNQPVPRNQPDAVPEPVRPGTPEAGPGLAAPKLAAPKLAAPEQAAPTTAAKAARGESRKPAPAPEPAAPAAAAPLAAPPPATNLFQTESMEPARGREAEQAAPAPAKAKAKDEASAEADRILAGPPVAGSAAGSTLEVPIPATLERLPGGRAQLKVLAPSGRSLYVLRRTASGTTALPPAESLPQGAGLVQSIFRFALDPSDRVDLYVLPGPVPAPETLPEQGPVQGYRRRIHP